MFSTRKESLTSPSLDDSFFPFSSSTPVARHRILGTGVRANSLLASHTDHDSSSTMLEKDLILAAEVGQALLERNEELEAQLEQMRRDVEAVQQEKHTLQRHLEVRELEAGQREAELQADIAALRQQFDQKHNQGRDRRREESEQLAQLSSHNQKLVEQLAEAVSVEHSLRLELRTLREEIEDTSFSRSINSACLDTLQAEVHTQNRVLKERCSNMDKQLKSSDEENERMRTERDGLRARLLELQSNLKEKEGELEQHQTEVFQLRTMNRSLQQRVQALGEEASLEEITCFPLSLQSELQQSQAKESILAHSSVLQEKEEEIERLKNELESSQEELSALREKVKTFCSDPNKPPYSALEEELALARQERDMLNQQLLNTIKHKVALSQEVESWQEDMRLVICQQVQQQVQERGKEKEMTASPLQRNLRTSRSFRIPREDGKKSFFSSLFGGD